MKKIMLSSLMLSLFFSSPSFATLSLLKMFVAKTHPQCENALPSQSAHFCSSFKKVASCYCESSGLPSSMCSDMHALYKHMLLIFNSQQQTCAYQQDVSAQSCMDAWNCYRHGGKNNVGQLCSATGKACV